MERLQATSLAKPCNHILWPYNVLSPTTIRKINNTFQMLTIWVSKKSHLRLLPLGWHALPSWPGWVHEFSPLLEAPCILSEYFCGSISLKHFWQWKIAESLENPCLIDFNYIGQGSMFYEGVALSVGQVGIHRHFKHLLTKIFPRGGLTLQP